MKKIISLMILFSGIAKASIPTPQNIILDIFYGSTTNKGNVAFQAGFKSTDTFDHQRKTKKISTKFEDSEIYYTYDHGPKNIILYFHAYGLNPAIIQVDSSCQKFGFPAIMPANIEFKSPIQFPRSVNERWDLNIKELGIINKMDTYQLTCDHQSW